MDTRFIAHNTHLEDPKSFAAMDPQLKKLSQQKYVYEPDALEHFPNRISGIYTLTGGRQTGKTTLLKQYMARLIKEGADPTCIAYFSGELIDDHHALLQLLQDQLEIMPDNKMKFLILDEATYIKDWDKTVKYLADAGLLEKIILFISGSDMALIQDARTRFPGRRGKSHTVDFHIHPLSFREFLQLKNTIPLDDLQSNPNTTIVEKLFAEFQNYLKHGGYLTAINDLAMYGSILDSTLHIYSDWIRGDMLKSGKHEHYLKEIIKAIIKRYNTQITWNALAKDLSIDHPKTVADYLELLSSMEAVFIQQALLEDKLVGAPKKARKVVFSDPFIFHALRAWLHPVKNIYEKQINQAIDDNNLCASIVEACAATHYKRFYPTYYIKAEGEVDIAYIHKEKFWPVEIKWTSRLNPKDLKQIAKYKNGIILNKTIKEHSINAVKTIPLALQLALLSEQSAI